MSLKQVGRKKQSKIELVEYPPVDLISVIGPTASGKTALVKDWLEARLFNKYHGVAVISLDSRQVYKEIPIISGADLPTIRCSLRDDLAAGKIKAESIDLPEGSQSDYIFHLGAMFFGVGIISGQEDWSLSHVRVMTEKLIKIAALNNWLVIIVGGTMLYERWLLTDDFVSVPVNMPLRRSIMHKSVGELRQMLQEIAPGKLETMNNSDAHNPRRLIRQIEIALYKPENHILKPVVTDKPKANFLAQVALKPDLVWLEAKILTRVQERLAAGAVSEVKDLMEKRWFAWRLPVATASGVDEIYSFLKVGISEESMIKAWVRSEMVMVKNQLKWLKKNEVFTILDSSQEGFVEKARLIVKQQLV